MAKREGALEIENRVLKEMLARMIQERESSLKLPGMAGVASPTRQRKTPSGPGDKDWTKIDKKCPKCHEVKRVLPDFGIRAPRGIVYAQPWCKDCRSKANYHKKPRKNASKHNQRTV